MTVDDVKKWLYRKPFQPFKITLQDGTVREIPLRILAQVSIHGEIYVYERSEKEFADVKGPPETYPIKDIARIEAMEYEPTDYDRVV